jgi:hypothetical protein
MKNLLILSALSVFALVACNKTEGPKEVATKFLTELNSANYDAASAYGTQATKDMLNMIKTFAGDQKPEKAPTFTISDVKEEGDTATVTYRTEGTDADETLDLVKADGKWLVDMKKEDPGLGDWEGEEEMDWDGEGEEGAEEGTEATEEVQE